MIQWLNIPYTRADCVRLTRLFLRARGVRTRDPRLSPGAWVACAPGEALAITYKDRSHIAPIDQGYALETRPEHHSKRIPIERLRFTDIEYWRPA